ncbi:hypothetical protein TWF730_005903 [Orbilia blumenaviensis]|uniref:Uncharacterized protein n=1 Tax=Orbilia blumenaviensis TaxID=1796055 RepID=A0AAV9VMY7_9PEZI
MPTGAIVLTPLSGEEACCGVTTLTNTLQLYARPYWRTTHSDGKPRTREFELDTANIAKRTWQTVLAKAEPLIFQQDDHYSQKKFCIVSVYNAQRALRD